MSVVTLTEPCVVDPCKQGEYVVFTLDGGLTLEILVEEIKKYYALDIVHNNYNVEEPYRRLNLCIHAGDSHHVVFEFPKVATYNAVRWFEIVHAVVSM
jgi:hypothetical protein